MRELLGRDFDKKRLEAARQEAAYERRRRMRADRSAKRWVEQAIQAKLRAELAELEKAKLRAQLAEQRADQLERENAELRRQLKQGRNGGK